MGSEDCEYRPHGQLMQSAEEAQPAPDSLTQVPLSQEKQKPPHQRPERVITRKSMSQNVCVSNTVSSTTFMWLITKSILSRMSLQVKILSTFADLKTVFMFLLNFLFSKLSY